MGATTSKNDQKNKFSTVHMIGIPMGYGQDWEIGVEDAPSAFRSAGIKNVLEELGYVFVDRGDVKVHESPKASKTDPFAYSEFDIKNSTAIGQTLHHMFKECVTAAKQGAFVLNVGGDHSIGSTSIMSMKEVYPDLGVIWVDAHGDCNTPETSTSHNYHGMPAAHALGWFEKRAPGFDWLNLSNPLKEEKLVYIGLRDLDVKEKELLKNSKIKIFTMQDIDKIGIAKVMDDALSFLCRSHVDTHNTPSTGFGCLPSVSSSSTSYNGPHIHLTFDVDGIDPSVAPGTGTLARGGLSYREAHYICESLAETGKLVSMDLVEVNPRLDVPDSYIRQGSESTSNKLNPTEQHPNFVPDNNLSVSPTPSPKTGKSMHGDSPLINTESQTVRLAIELIASALGKTIL